MNPYRIATRADRGAQYPDLHPSIKPEWVMNHEKIQIYNPALPEVRERLTDIVRDLIEKYEVDGIHFDDYFYPRSEEHTSELQSRGHLVCRLLLEKKKNQHQTHMQ